MIKIIGGTLILAASTIAGFMYGESFKKRVIQLSEIQRSLYQLQNEIEFTHTALPEAFSNISKKSIYPLDKLYSEISELLYLNKVENVNEAFEISIKDMKENLFLANEDVNIILDLSKTLGESDILGQKAIFSLTFENLNKQITAAEVKMQKNVKMFRYLGFAFGAAIVTVLI
ncbi:MAG: stage III sporulation protein SpoIIIAB [Bacillota bacterium]|nr:stage III sporulation protein SpoIIIAB [Bacillota bacterium]